MQSLLARVWLLLLCVFCLSNSFSQNVPQDPPIQTDDQGLLWKIEGKNLSAPCYLYGTLETSSKLAYHLSDSFFVAFRNAKRVIITLHPDSVENAQHYPALMRRYYQNNDIDLSYSPAYNYYSQLTPQKTDEGFWEYVVSGLAVNPWMLYTASDDSEEEKSLSEFMYLSALKLKKPVLGLISMEEELSYREKQTKYFQDKKENTDNEREDYGESELVVERALAAYRRGDLASFDSLYRKYVNDTSYFRQVLEPRYRFLAAKLAERLQDNKPFLAVVEVFALPGDSGIIAALRAGGYHVTAVKHQIITKPNPEVRKLENLTSPASFVPYTSRSGLWSVMIPENSQSAHAEEGLTAGFTDRVNDVTFYVWRIPNHSQVEGKTPAWLFAQMDSVFFEFVPGKVVRRREHTLAGYPAVDVTSRISRDRQEMFRLVITPIEVILVRVSGPRKYLRKNKAGEKFIRSAKIHPPAGDSLITCSPEHGEFAVSLPAYHFADSTLSHGIFPAPDLEYQAWDPVSGSWYLLKRKVHFDLETLEEDTFDLHFMAESIAKTQKKELVTGETAALQGYPSYTFSLWSADAPDTLYHKIIKAGKRLYLLAVRTSDPLRANRYFESFTLKPVVYALRTDTLTDTVLACRVVSGVPKQEWDLTGSNENEYADWNDSDYEQKKREYSHLPQRRQATWYFPDGDEYIVAERLKLHDYTQFSSFGEFREVVTRNATRKNDLQVIRSGADSACAFPWIDLVLGDTGTIALIHKRFILHHGALFTLTTMSDTITGEPPYTRLFFRSFTPIADTLAGISPFADKGSMFLRNYLSNDTIAVKQAISSVDKVQFGVQHYDSLLLILKDKALMQRNLELTTHLIEAFGRMDAPRTPADLQQLYHFYQGQPALQVAVFKALIMNGRHHSAPMVMEILTSDPPLPDDEAELHTLIKPFQKTSDQYVKILKDLIGMERYPEYRKLVYGVVLGMIEDKKLSKEQSAGLYPALRSSLSEEVKRNRIYLQSDPADTEKPGEKTRYLAEEEDGYDWEEEFVEEDDPVADDRSEDLKDTLLNDPYANVSDLMMLYRMVYPLTPKQDSAWLESVTSEILRGKIRNDALSVTLYLAKKGRQPADSLHLEFIRDPRIRLDYYRMRKESGLDFQDSTKQFTQQSIAESMLYREVDAEESDSITYVGKRFIHTPRREGYVCFFKYRSGYGSDKDWYLGAVGIQPADTLEISVKPDFLLTEAERIFPGDDLEKLMDKMVTTQFRKLYRKRFSDPSSYETYYEEEEAYEE
ncbi:MAG TPA: TraB/GumN family protein [Bacteroidales bacterium]|nr:TraB/GumN family protein [Bacteroidales bacterium]HRZ49426.1 TraB/GumN family protein [Bacteroidales bacterium]